jgi:hypothetical protein
MVDTNKLIVFVSEESPAVLAGVWFHSDCFEAIP